MATSYDILKQGDFTYPIENELDIPTHDATTMKIRFAASVNDLKITLNAALDVLGAHRDALVAWQEDMQDLLTGDQAANLSAAIISANAAIDALEAMADLVFTNVNVTTSGWATYTPDAGEETLIHNDGYTYCKSLALEGVDPDAMTLHAIASKNKKNCGTSINDGMILYDGGIKIYAKATPTAAFDFLELRFIRS